MLVNVSFSANHEQSRSHLKAKGEYSLNFQKVVALL